MAETWRFSLVPPVRIFRFIDGFCKGFRRHSQRRLSNPKQSNNEDEEQAEGPSIVETKAYGELTGVMEAAPAPIKRLGWSGPFAVVCFPCHYADTREEQPCGGSCGYCNASVSGGGNGGLTSFPTFAILDGTRNGLAGLAAIKWEGLDAID